jgi:hypothetical protein
MEQWAANTLRTLGVILTGGLIVIISIVMLLFSFCAFTGGVVSGAKNPAQGLVLIATAIGVMGVGVVVINRLARGIIRSHAAARMATGPGTWTLDSPRSAMPATDILLPLPPASREAVNRLVYALVAQIVLSAIAWFFGQVKYWNASGSLQPHNWMLILVAPFILYHVPYAILIYHLLKKLDRRTFTYSLVVPSVLILQSLFSLALVSYFYIRHPAGFVLILVPWLIHIVILAFAWQAVHQLGIHPEPSSLIVAALVTYVYLSIIPAGTPLLYLYGRR